MLLKKENDTAKFIYAEMEAMHAMLVNASENSFGFKIFKKNAFYKRVKKDIHKSYAVTL